MEIREASKLDGEMLSDICSRCMASAHEVWSAGAFESAVDSGHERVFLVEEEGRIAGYIAFIMAGDEAELLSIAVLPEYRRRGAGKALIKNMCLECREAGINAIYLEVRKSNEKAAALYTSVGMDKAGCRKGFYENPKEDGIIYRMELKNA